MITRRTFLRLAAATAIGSAVAACDTGAPEPAATQPAAPAAPASTPAATAAPVQIALAGGDADVWAWQRQASGRLVGECAEAYLAVGDTRAALARDGDRFSALARLQEGPNTIAAICRQQDGREERSNVQSYTVPLKRRPTAVPKITIAGGEIVLDGSASQPDEVGAAAIGRYLWSFRADNPAALASPSAEKDGQQLVGQRAAGAGHRQR